MRSFVLMILFTQVMALPASAQVGPPEPRAECHGYSLGAGIHNVHSLWTPCDYEVDRNRIYIEGSYAFTDSVEAFARVGGSDFVINDIETYDPGLAKDVHDDGYPVFLSGGLRGKAWHFGRWSLGASLEAAWYPGFKQTIRWDYDVYQELFFDSTTEISAGLSLGCTLGRSIFYGGPLLHFAYTRADVRTHEFGPDWDIEDSIDDQTVRDKAGWGGFLGWRRPVGEIGWHVQFEGAALRDGFGGSLGLFRSW